MTRTRCLHSPHVTVVSPGCAEIAPRSRLAPRSRRDRAEIARDITHQTPPTPSNKLPNEPSKCAKFRQNTLHSRRMTRIPSHSPPTLSPPRPKSTPHQITTVCTASLRPETCADTNELLSNADLHSREVLNALTLNVLRRPPFLLPLTRTQHTPPGKSSLVLRCHFRKALPRPTNHTTP